MQPFSYYTIDTGAESGRAAKAVLEEEEAFFRYGVGVGVRLSVSIRDSKS
jgi:hypothetical protein